MLLADCSSRTRWSPVSRLNVPQLILLSMQQPPQTTAVQLCQAVSFIQVSKPKLHMPFSSARTCHRSCTNHLSWSDHHTNHEVPHYVIFSLLLLIPHLSAHLTYSTPYSKHLQLVSLINMGDQDFD